MTQSAGNSSNTGDQLPAGVTVNETGKKQLDDVPYDIWFEKPLAIVQPTDLKSPGDTMNSAAPHSDPKSAPAAGSSPSMTSATNEPNESASSSDWDSLVSPSVLEEEVTRISISLGGYLNQLGSFNRTRNEIAEESEALKAVALVASQLQEELRWKEQALILVDCGARLVEQSETAGRASFTSAQVPLQQIRSVLNGEQVTLDHQVNQEVNFSDRVDRGAVMYRMESAFNWLAENIDSEGKLKSEQKTALRETAILTMLGKIIASPGYPSAEEAGYHEEAAGFTTTAKGMQSAIQANDFGTFQTNLDRLEKHCADCHADYRFE
ncbi:cytochrome c [Polystyrenella longa]|nr:cytochrome c [Polystyrenella longa]